MRIIRRFEQITASIKSAMRKHQFKVEHNNTRSLMINNDLVCLIRSKLITIALKTQEAATKRCFAKRGFKKFHKIDRKTPVLGSLFNTVSGLKA